MLPTAMWSASKPEEAGTKWPTLAEYKHFQGQVNTGSKQEEECFSTQQRTMLGTKGHTQGVDSIDECLLGHHDDAKGPDGREVVLEKEMSHRWHRIKVRLPSDPSNQEVVLDDLPWWLQATLQDINDFADDDAAVFDGPRPGNGKSQARVACVADGEFENSKKNVSTEFE